MIHYKLFKRYKIFAKDVISETPLVKLIFLLTIFWFLFSAALYYSESDNNSSVIKSYGDALYWGVAAFSTAGIADTPVNGISKLIGGLWIVVGSILFFGTIVATVTSYFMRPLQRPAKRIIDTIEYNLEQLEDLSVEELDLLRETTDALILHMERIKEEQIAIENSVHKEE